MHMQEYEPAGLTFPCDFPIKAMGNTSAGFDALVAGLVRRHGTDIHEGAVRTRLGRDGRYMSVSVTVRAYRREQLDTIYLDLTANDNILVVL